MSEIGRFLANLPRQRKFTVTIAGLEYFKNPDNSRLLFAKVEPSEGLIQLAADTDHFLGQLKVPLESREYAPHVTIGRIPGQNPWPKLDERIGEHADTHFGTFEAAEYSLYQSTPAGYRVIETIPLD
jgi:2'-5' RNA ligase